MKLRATLFGSMFLLPAFLLMAVAPTAAAANGDTLLNGVQVVPGNPCNAAGPAGGIAVKEAGTAGVVYYSSRNSTRIHMTNSHVSTTSPTVCLGGFNAAVPGTDGFQALAYDAFHSSVRLWAVRNNSATVHGLTLAGAVVTTFTVPGVSQITGIAVGEAAPYDLFLSSGGANVLRYSKTATPSLLSTTSYPYGVANLAAWGGALLASDGSDWVRNHKQSDGSWLGLVFHPGDSWVDQWWQTHRYWHTFSEMAFDETSYTGRGALWGIETAGGWFCVAQCAVYQCLQYEGPDCIQWGCIQWCNPGDAILGYRVWPTIRAFEVKRTCPGGANVPPDQDCPCPAPVPTPTFTSPANAILVRGVPTSPAAQPILVQGSATVTASGSSPDHVISLKGPLPSGPTVVGYGSASAATLVASAVPRGAYTYEASLFDSARGCRGGVAKLTVWVEDPVSHTAAHALRIEGNIPINTVLETIRAEPLDTLAGSEETTVVDRELAESVALDVGAFVANATHAPVRGDELQLLADARAVVLDGAATIDLATLCDDLTGDPACVALPTVSLTEEDLRADASASMRLVTAAGGATASTGLHQGRIKESFQGSVLDHSVGNCLPNGACQLAVGGFVATFADTWQRATPLSVESYAAALRIEITQGAYRGEIVVSEAYAGISLGGRALLAGPTKFVEAQDDYATGGDAPATAGPSLAPDLWSGQFQGADRADSFVVPTLVGQKLRVVIDPAHRVGVSLSPLPTLPASLVAPRLLRVTLSDPAGVVRDVSSLGVLDAHPALVELNVDVSGDWRVLVERLDTRDEAAPYTVAIQHASVTLLSGDDGATCTSATPMPPTGTVAASMGATDAADTFALTAGAGEAMTALLKSDDLEGADFDLRFLDSGCNLVAQSTEGKDPMPKGEPDALTNVPVPAGAAFAQVVRVNGIGNYVLQAKTHKVI